MAHDQGKLQHKKKPFVHVLPLTRTNYRILGGGLLVITLGYAALVQDPWDGFMPLVVAPILLVIGYCVLIPFGILYRAKNESPKNGPAAGESPRST